MGRVSHEAVELLPHARLRGGDNQSEAARTAPRSPGHKVGAEGRVMDLGTVLICVGFALWVVAILVGGWPT